MKPNLNTFSPASTSRSPNKTLPYLKAPASISVIGAGAFGGWTALHLLRSGFKVTLIDCWGPGNSRSSSGDETRVIRSTYGSNEFYFNLNVRALQLWKEHEQRFQKKIFHNTGVLWLCHDEKTPLVDDSIPFAIKNKMEYELMSPAALVNRYPILNSTDLSHGYFDPYGGYLKARESCIAVAEAFIKEGGTFVQQSVKPGSYRNGDMECIHFQDGSTYKTDAYIFACGSWLGSIFPALSGIITCSKQEVYYFGVPATKSIAFDSFPVWIDADGKDFYYGISGNSGRGFKIGVDKRGEPFDPSTSERRINEETFLNARNFLTNRFPDLKDTPLIESRVCPYENSPDGNFIFDLLPSTTNTFILGGGSGHGFKHAPALGELVTQIIIGQISCPPLLHLEK
jgi:glycine/D-amino acid oxidase-like deaminating enzyme